MAPVLTTRGFRAICVLGLFLPVLAWIWAHPPAVWDLAWPARLLGVIGAVGFACSLLLMVRAPYWERWFGGLDQQYLLHHWFGSGSYLALLAHTALLIVDRYRVSPTAALDLLPMPWDGTALGWGWLALLVLMLMFIGTFVVRLPYQAWKWLHASTALAFLAAAGHVQLFGAAHGGIGVWLGVALVAGVAALGWRYLVERAVVSRHDYLVTRVQHLDERSVEIELRPLADTALDFQPGQFVFVAFRDSLTYRGCREYHPFTLTSAPTDPHLHIVVKALGDCTQQIQRIEIGVPASVQGPFGAFFRQAPTADRAQLWLAGGIGITPFLGMARAMPAVGPAVDLYYFARSEEQAVCLRELRALVATQPRLTLHTVYDDHPLDFRTLLLQPPLTTREVYLCGPPAMVQAQTAALVALGLPQSQLHTERFDFV